MPNVMVSVSELQIIAEQLPTTKKATKWTQKNS